jgi:hypothetical protein
MNCEGLQHHEWVSDWYTETRYVQQLPTWLSVILFFNTWQKQTRQQRLHAEWDTDCDNPQERKNYREWFERNGDEGWSTERGVPTFTFGFWTSPDTVNQWDFKPPEVTIGGTIDIGDDGYNPAVHDMESSKPDSYPEIQDIGDNSSDLNSDGSASETLADKTPPKKIKMERFGHTDSRAKRGQSVEETVLGGKRLLVGQTVDYEFLTHAGNKILHGGNVNVIPGKEYVITDIQVMDHITYGHDAETGMEITYAEFLLILSEVVQ